MTILELVEELKKQNKSLTRFTIYQHIKSGNLKEGQHYFIRKMHYVMLESSINKLMNMRVGRRIGSKDSKPRSKKKLDN